MKDTVGKLSAQLLKSAKDDTHSAEEQMREQLTDYDRHIFECVERGKKEFPNDFYVVVITKKEKLMRNVLRCYFAPRITCPTPDYDQTLYKFIRKEEHLEFMWVLPSQETCQFFVANALQVPADERDLLNFILQFTDGSLLKLAKKLNNEEPDSILIAQ
jgi:hypothetical protein